MKTSKKSREQIPKNPENPEKIASEEFRKSGNPGDCDLFFRDIRGIFEKSPVFPGMGSRFFS